MANTRSKEVAETVAPGAAPLGLFTGISHDWNPYFSAVEGVMTARARHIEMRSGAEGRSMTALYRIDSFEEASSITQRLQQSGHSLVWTLSRISVVNTHAQSLAAPGGLLDGQWVAVERADSPSRGR